MNNKQVEDIVREVLDEYEGSHINLDSFAARDILAKHISKQIEDNIIDSSDYIDDDLSV